MSSFLSKIMQLGQVVEKVTPGSDQATKRLPARPPRPNFEDLTPEEIEKMNDVIKKLEALDRQESDEIRLMRESIQRFELYQQRQLRQRNRFIASSNYVCRLCFKTKFVEKMARICTSCGHKICSRCGLYVHDPVGNGKQILRWRCRLCQLKREYACKTGHWYHGDAAQPVLEKNELWLAVQKNRGGNDQEKEGRRLSDGSIAVCMSTSRLRTVPDISINQTRNSRDLTYFTQSRGIVVPPRHPPDVKRPLKGPLPSERQAYRPRSQTVSSTANRCAMKPTMNSRLGFDASSKESLNCSRQSFRREDQRLHRDDNRARGSMNVSRSLAQSSPNIAAMDSCEPEPCSMGMESRRSSRESREGCQFKPRAPRSHSLHREQMISDDEDTDSHRLSVGDLYVPKSNVIRHARKKQETSMHSDTDSSSEAQYKTREGRPSRRHNSVTNLSNTKDEILLLQQKCQELASNVDDDMGTSKSGVVSESCDSDDLEYDFHASGVVQPALNDWQRNPSSEDKTVFKKQQEKKHLFLKNEISREDRSSPVLSRIEWTPNRRRSCEMGASPLVRHMRLRNASSCDRVSLSSVETSGSSVQPSTIDSTEPSSKDDSPTFNITLEAEDDEGSISNFRRFGFRLCGGVVSDHDEMVTVISHVSPNYPAKIQGHLDKGDEILTWNGHDLTGKTYEEVLLVVDAAVSTLTLTVKRKPEEQISLDLDESSIENDSSDKLLDSDLSLMLEKNHSDPEDIQHLNSAMVETKTSDDEMEEILESPVVSYSETKILTPDDSVKRKWKNFTSKTGRRKSGSCTDARRLSQVSMCSTTGGRVEVSIKRQFETNTVDLCLLKAQWTAEKSKDSGRAPNVVVLVRLLPHPHLHKSQQTDPKFSCNLAVLNEEMTFTDVTHWQLKIGTLEITVWDAKEDSVFDLLGESLIDFEDLEDKESTATWYSLFEHDENSALLEKPSAVDLSPFVEEQPTLEEPVVCKSVPAPTVSPVTSPAPKLTRGENLGPDSFRSKMKKKMTTAIGKLSVGGEGRREQLTSEGKKNASSPTADREMARRSPLLTRLKKSTIPSVQVTDSADENHFQFGSVNNSMEDLDDVDGDSETSEKQTSPAIEMATKTGSSQRPNPEGDDTTELGPGQVCPAQGIETTSFGELKLGVVMTKGQLEVHIMSAKRLPLGANGQAPDTYVKTYLTDSTRKRTQKKKTNIVKSSVEPMYRQKTKYSACNVYRRQIVASVWEKSAVFDKNQSIGEVTINLDDLDLSALKPSWYRLFKYDASAADSDSDN